MKPPPMMKGILRRPISRMRRFRSSLFLLDMPSLRRKYKLRATKLPGNQPFQRLICALQTPRA